MSLILVIALALLAYTSLVPFYYVQDQSLSKALPIFSLAKYFPLVLALLWLIAWCIGWFKERKVIVLRFIFLLMVLYLLIALFSLWGAPFAKVGLLKWFYYNATGIMLCFLVVQHGRTWSVLRQMARCAIAISVLSILYSLLIAVLSEDPLWGQLQAEHNPYYTQHRLAGPFGHTVATASYAMFMWPFAIWMTLSEKAPWPRRIGLIICPLYPLVIALTQTRGAMLACGICVVLMFPWMKRGWGELHRRKLLRWFALAGVVAVVLMTNIGIGGNAQRLAQDIKGRWDDLLKPGSVAIPDGDRVYHYGSMIEYTERFRIAQYFTVANILREHPYLGVGFGTYTRSFEKYRHSENYMVREFAEHTTENMYLMFLAETGWVGLIFRLMLIAGIAIVAIQSYRKAHSGERRDFLFAYWVAAGGLNFNLLTWDLLNEPTLRIYYWVYTGMALAACCIREDQANNNNAVVVY